MCVMYLLELLSTILHYLGLCRKSNVKLFLLSGLDNASKTPFLHILRDNRLGQHPPTLHSTKEELNAGGITFKAIDLGGYRTAHRVLKDYPAAIVAVVVMINANDRARFKESRVELAGFSADEQLADVPILILANQTDIPGAASEDELRQAFGLQDVTTGKGIGPKKDLQRRPVELFMCSVPKREGLDDGFNWLAQYLD